MTWWGWCRTRQDGRLLARHTRVGRGEEWDVTAEGLEPWRWVGMGMIGGSDELAGSGRAWKGLCMVATAVNETKQYDRSTLLECH